MKPKKVSIKTKKPLTKKEFFELEIEQSPIEVSMNTSQRLLEFPQKKEELTFDEMMREGKRETLEESFTRLRLFKANNDTEKKNFALLSKENKK